MAGSKKTNDEAIYITGHRNPDTDSIVSAMAYAALKNALGDQRYLAARLGELSDETQCVLERFKFQPPLRINNVRTQVRDLDFDRPPTLSAAATINYAWQLMQSHRISAIPVTNEDGTLYGMLSAGDVASYDMASVDNAWVEQVPVFNLLSVLEGKILNEGFETADSVSGEVTVALPTSRENLLFSQPDSIVICGNQADMLRRALTLKVNCAIVCQAEIPPELLAESGSTCVISTPFDAYKTMRLISHALPIGSICKSTDLVSFHLDDYIDDVQDTVLESRFRCYPVLDDAERVVGTLARFHLLRPRRKQVILMDHNETAQSVPGLEQADILEIVDHHRLADIQTKNPIYVRNEPVGSTTTIVATMYQEKGLMPSADMAGLMAAAIVSDTVMFKSPTCTPQDIAVANRLARIADISLDEVGKAIFAAGSGEGKAADELLNTDYKEFHIAGHSLAVSQVTCMDSAALLLRRDEFLSCMERLRSDKGLEMVVLMITDVLQEGSYLLFCGNEEDMRLAFNLKSDSEPGFVPSLMSRKKQLIPTLSGLWG